MSTTNIVDQLTREHHDIDSGIEEFLAGLESDKVDEGALRRAIDALRRHIYLEEELLFPPIRREGTVMPLMVMVKEHGEAWGQMDELEAALDSGSVAPEALRDECTRLLATLDRHNSKEEPIIYPRTDIDLNEDETATLADFLDTGTMPDGWVCAAAQ